MKRRAIVTLALIAAMTLSVTAMATHQFGDVPDDHLFARGIEWAADNGLVVGYTNGDFGPEDHMTRGQLVTVLKRYHEGIGAPVPGPAGADGQDGADGAPGGPPGADGQDGVSGYQIFSMVQDFGPGGIGGTWCGAPDGATEDLGWRVMSGGAQLSATDLAAGVVVASSWPNVTDPNNPGWNIQVNAPPNVDPGNVTVYAVCVKVPVS